MIPQAMGVAIRDIDSGAAAVLPTVWLIVRRTDGRIIGDLGTHGPPDSQRCGGLPSLSRDLHRPATRSSDGRGGLQ